MTSELSKRLEPVDAVDFGRLILEAKAQSDPALTYEILRAESASVASYSDVSMVDDQLLTLS